MLLYLWKKDKEFNRCLVICFFETAEEQQCDRGLDLSAAIFFLNLFISYESLFRFDE